MKSIGGYFELELSNRGEYHEHAIRLNTARNALEYILRVRKYKKVYIPLYTCEVILEPFKKLNVDYEFYNIDEYLKPIINFELKENDALLLNNYFGLTGNYVNELVKKHTNVIIDNSQAFFEKPIGSNDVFYSARKFFGVPDGAYLKCNKKLETDIEQDLSCERFEHLLGRIEINPQQFYNVFKRNDSSLKNQDIKVMSNLTQSILKSIDYKKNMKKRINNFLYLHNRLNKTNLLKLNIGSSSIPMVYPYLIDDGKFIKKKLISNKIYVATYWPNVFGWAAKNSFEYYLASNLIALPIDQRYDIEDLKHVISILGRENGE